MSTRPALRRDLPAMRAFEPQGVLSVCTRLIAAIRFGPWQIRHSSFCGLLKAMSRRSQTEAPLVCMWSIAAGVSWHAEQAAAIGEVTSVVPCAWHGAAVVHVATVPVHLVAAAGAAGSVTQVQGVACEQVMLPCLKVTDTPWIVTGLSTTTVQGLVVVQRQGLAGVQVTVALLCVPLTPSG